MAYFKKFKKIAYPFEISGKKSKIILTDLTKSVRIVDYVLSNLKALDNYIIKDGETVEEIAEKFYGDPELHWLVMLANNRYNYIEDFPRTQLELDLYVEQKYGNTADDIKEYVFNGYIVDSTVVGAIPYTNRQVEELENEQKRLIKIVPKVYLNQVLAEFERLME